MIIKELEKLFHNDLEGLYAKEEVYSFFVLIIEHYFKTTRVQLALTPDLSITKDEEHLFFNAIKHLKAGKPIQYLLGQTEFYSLPFKVNKKTLIPRPETEELVRWAIECLKNRIKKSEENNKVLSILDIGTGSGCIAISLAKNLPNVKVYALDVSKGALDIAKQNAKLNKVKVHFINADILKPEQHLDLEFNKSKFDLIISNPPYVRAMEKKYMHTNVLHNEPHLALFVENDNPLLFYNKITAFAKNKLQPDGELFFEINEYLGQETLEILKRYRFINLELKKDFFGKQRMLRGVMPHYHSANYTS